MSKMSVIALIISFLIIALWTGHDEWWQAAIFIGVVFAVNLIADMSEDKETDGYPRRR